jgi:hypothetical protein
VTPIAGRNSLYVTYWTSAPTILRAIWNLSSLPRLLGRRETMRLCSRAKSVCIPVSPMFSFARTSPATTAFAGLATCAAKRSIVGAVDESPRASRRGR